jgi:hypothetical protein
MHCVSQLNGAVLVEVRERADSSDSLCKALSALHLSSGQSFQRHDDSAAGSSSKRDLRSLRQRGGGGGSDSGSNSMVADEPESSGPPQQDTLQLFGGLVPPPLRKAKRNFTAALDYALLVATLTQRVVLLHAAVMQCEAEKQQQQQQQSTSTTVAEIGSDPTATATTADDVSNIQQAEVSTQVTRS